MFFGAKCPIQLVDKVWVEISMQSLTDELGVDQLTNTTMLYLEDFEADDKTDAEFARDCVEFILGQMDLPSTSCRLEIVEPGELDDMDDRYRPGDDPVVFVPNDELEEKFHLVSQLAYELTKHVLVSRGFVQPDHPDYASISHLATLFFGFGIFSANSTVFDNSWTDGSWTGWSMRKRGILSSQTMGYALALLAKARNDMSPPWASDLRFDAQEIFVKSIKFLGKSQDVVFEPTAPGNNHWTRDQLITMLSSKSKTEQLAALWQLEDGIEELDSSAVEPVLRCLSSREVAIRQAAATLIAYAPVSTDVFEQIERCLTDDDPIVRGRLARAVGLQSVDKEFGKRILVHMVGDHHSEVVVGAAMSLVSLADKNDSEIANALANRLNTAVVNQNEPLAADLIRLLTHSVDNVKELLDEKFSHDYDLHVHITQLFDEFQQQSSSEFDEQEQ